LLLAVKPRFFKTSSELRTWLEKNHDSAPELWVGFRKKGSGKAGITWPEAVDQALCFGWIDSVRKSIDQESYTNRFTPRKPRSTWSAFNVERAGELIEQGLMRSPGLVAFEARDEKRTAIYSYEQRPHRLPAEFERKLKANRRAWEFWRSQAPSYRRAATWWVVSAKKDETRLRRLATLIESSGKGQRAPPLAGPAARRVDR
jgi:uncharacterized protein YdeI (YjbR/CyaY-like superfamily)